jgi:hypothetical protein
MSKAKKITYYPAVRWHYPLILGDTRLYEIGYDTKTKEIILKIQSKGEQVFETVQLEEIKLPSSVEGSNK